jgi:hypothetical protein
MFIVLGPRLRGDERESVLLTNATGEITPRQELQFGLDRLDALV